MYNIIIAYAPFATIYIGAPERIDAFLAKGLKICEIIVILPLSFSGKNGSLSSIFWGGQDPFLSIPHIAETTKQGISQKWTAAANFALIWWVLRREFQKVVARLLIVRPIMQRPYNSQRFTPKGSGINRETRRRNGKRMRKEHYNGTTQLQMFNRCICLNVLIYHNTITMYYSYILCLNIFV